MSRTDAGRFSPTMRSCLHYIREHGGIICRYPGGFWAHVDWKSPSDGPWFGTSTVEALESRGAGTYTRWQQRKGGGSSFPIEFTLSTQAASDTGDLARLS